MHFTSSKQSKPFYFKVQLQILCLRKETIREYLETLVSADFHKDL